MTVAEYIEALRECWPDGADATLSCLRLADEAVADHPTSVKLWVMRGDVIQLGPIENPHPLSTALESYERAVAIDSTCSEGWESIGYYHDVHTNDLDAAEQAFRRAIAEGGSVASWTGLARVLAEKGAAQEALALLNTSPFVNDPNLHRTRCEIEEGDWNLSCAQVA